MTDAPKRTLTEAERESLFKAGDHHPDQCDCTAFADEVGYAPGHGEVCGGLEDTYDVVARIKAAARREALLEAADVLGQLRYTGGNVDFADGREFEAGRIAGWLLELAEPERDEEGR